MIPNRLNCGLHERPTLPPATFEFLIFSLRAQAEMNLGLLDFGPDEDPPEQDLELARHSIDILAILHEKTKGNLQTDEQHLLEGTLTDLRLRFVQATQDAGKP